MNDSCNLGSVFLEVVCSTMYFPPPRSRFSDPSSLFSRAFFPVFSGFFLDASSHLHKRVCPSVRPSVCPLPLLKNCRKALKIAYKHCSCIRNHYGRIYLPARACLVFPSVRPSVFPPVWMSVLSSIWLSLRAAVNSFVLPSVWLSVPPSVRPSVLPS